MTQYNNEPTVTIQGWDKDVRRGYDPIVDEIAERIKQQKKSIITVECYPAVRIEEIIEGLKGLDPVKIFFAEEAALESEQIEGMLSRYMTDDRVFGYIAPFTIVDFYDTQKIEHMEREISNIHQGTVLIIGFGASLIGKGDIQIYADLARWEIQQRYRSKEFGNWRIENYDEDILRKYKRGYFIEWRVADRLKRELLEEMDYYLDTNVKEDPKLLTREALFAGFEQTVKQSFRLVPFFDPGVWGGSWLQEKIGLEPQKNPYAWGFDGVPEENSLYFQYGHVRLELPSINLVFFKSISLLGESIYSRFGGEFPIRFDFLDTIEGQNLSLQVHPETDYIQQCFGMHYTQDESYYILDTKDHTEVYLGIKDEADKTEMMNDLKLAEKGEYSFPAKKYVNVFPAKKHDHVLIPAGTVHCSGANSMVLEISATPYIFTFKLWDWDRLGLDGKPRPVHLKHGFNNINWERKTKWVENNLINRVEKLDEGEGWIAEKTGLHELQFIETHRHWFTNKVPHHTNGGVQVLNLVEGKEAVIESPKGDFEPFLVHYAETFIIPAEVGEYTIRPTEKNPKKQLATIKAFVR